jgi:predicted nucleic acid-binding protein
MKRFFDTSALVTAVVDQLPNHRAALACYTRLIQPRCPGPKPVCSTHALAECYATLTALPLARRIQSAEAARLIEENFLEHLDVVPLSTADYKTALARVSSLGLPSGAIYDALHVRCAEPVSLDHLTEQFIGDGAQSLDTKKLGVAKIAFEVCHQINRVTPITSFGLVCGLILSKPGAAVARRDLDGLLDKVRIDTKLLGIPLAPDLEEDFLGTVRGATDRLLKDGILQKYDTDGNGEGVKIPEKQRLVLSLVYYSELSQKEVAHVLGVTEARVSQLHKEAVERLRKRLNGLAFPAEDAW